MVLPVRSRFEQLEALASAQVDGAPVVIHGSIGHAAMMGDDLPSAIKFGGAVRDIDIFVPGEGDKFATEQAMVDMGVSEPHPIDAGLCSLIIRDGTDFYASKDDVTIPLADAHVLEETKLYELRGTDGLAIRSLGLMGLRAAHSIDPSTFSRQGMSRRIHHYRTDRETARWFEENDVHLPKNLQASIDTFHVEYRQRYPHAQRYNQIAGLYVRCVPEVIRRQLRTHTHRLMYKHAGRKSPYTPQ